MQEKPNALKWNLLWVLQQLFAFLDEFVHDGPLVLKLVQGFLLPLNQLFYVFNTTGSNLSCGAEHDTIQELNMRCQLITIGITFPVQVDFKLGLLNSWNKSLMFNNYCFEIVRISCFFVLWSFCHQDFKHLFEPSLDVCSFQIFAQSLKRQSL